MITAGYMARSYGFSLLPRGSMVYDPNKIKYAVHLTFHNMTSFDFLCGRTVILYFIACKRMSLFITLPFGQSFMYGHFLHIIIEEGNDP